MLISELTLVLKIQNIYSGYNLLTLFLKNMFMFFLRRFEEKKTEKKRPGRGGKKGRRQSIPSKGPKGGRVTKARVGKVSAKKGGGRKRR